MKLPQQHHWQQPPSSNNKVLHDWHVQFCVGGWSEWLSIPLLEKGRHSACRRSQSIFQRDGTSPLNEATRIKSFKFVVVTSSVGAICSDASDSYYKTPNNKQQRLDWASLEYEFIISPTAFLITTMAMHAGAWKIAGGQTQCSLVTIYPACVMGPEVQYHASSESFTVFANLHGESSMYEKWHKHTLWLRIVKPSVKQNKSKDYFLLLCGKYRPLSKWRKPWFQSMEPTIWFYSK